MKRKVYGWREDDKLFLSLLPRADQGPKNEYASEDELRKSVKDRRMELVWSDE